jgi:hypothetical protein
MVNSYRNISIESIKKTPAISRCFKNRVLAQGPSAKNQSNNRLATTLADIDGNGGPLLPVALGTRLYPKILTSTVKF